MNKGHKGQMSDRDVMKLALEAFEHWMRIDTVEDMHIFETVTAPEAIAVLRQALEQPEQVSVPDGWKLVPIEPTDAMLSVPVNIDLRECVTPGGVTGLDAVGLFRAWEAMIEAAPHPWDTTDMAYRAGGLSMEQEPVAWMTNSEQDTTAEYMFCHVQTPMHDIPLYTAPPKREWVGLTDEEEIELDEKYGDDFNAYIDARDAKLKEKNT